LKWAVETSAQGAGASARALLAEMRNLDDGPRSPEEICADVRRLRTWVEARQESRRRIILAARRGDSGPGEGTTPRPQARHDVHQRRSPPVSPAEPPRFSPPRNDPMWDDWLDG
jgi:hypothetical protein